MYCPAPTRTSSSFTAPICTSITTTPRGCMAATAPRASRACSRRRRGAGADAVLLAGDTFDCHRSAGRFAGPRRGRHHGRRRCRWCCCRATTIRLSRTRSITMARSPRCRTCMSSASRTRRRSSFSQLDLEIWGRPHRDYGDMIPFEDRSAAPTRWQIAVAHGHYVPVPDRSIRLRPSWLIGDDELAATAADYVALGHWNSRGESRQWRHRGVLFRLAGICRNSQCGSAGGHGAVAVTRAELDIAREPSAFNQ